MLKVYSLWKSLILFPCKKRIRPIILQRFLESADKSVNMKPNTEQS